MVITTPVSALLPIQLLVTSKNPYKESASSSKRSFSVFQLLLLLLLLFPFIWLAICKYSAFIASLTDLKLSLFFFCLHRHLPAPSPCCSSSSKFPVKQKIWSHLPSCPVSFFFLFVIGRWKLLAAGSAVRSSLIWQMSSYWCVCWCVGVCERVCESVCGVCVGVGVGVWVCVCVCKWVSVCA